MVVVALIAAIVLAGGIFLWARARSAVPVTVLSEIKAISPEEAIERVGVDVPAHRAIVLLSGNPTLSLLNVTRAMLKRWPGLGVIDPDLESTGLSRTLRLEGAAVRFELCGRMKHHDALERRLGANFVWPGADGLIENYVGTVLVEVEIDEARPSIDLSIVLSQAVYGLVRSCPTAAGVYWPAAGHVLSRKQVIDGFSLDFDERWPVRYWVGVFATEDDQGRVIGHTLGMPILGGLDFEVLDAPERPEEVRARLLGLIDYAAASGYVLHNGDTVGVDPHERISLEKRSAELGREGWVYRLTYLKPSPDNPWR